MIVDPCGVVHVLALSRWKVTVVGLNNLLLICLIINIFMNNFDLFINKTIIITERGC